MSEQDKCKMLGKRFLKNEKQPSPDQCGSVGWASSHKAKRRQFDSWSGHMPGLQVQSPFGAHPRGNQLMFLSHIDVSLSFSLPSPPSKK